MKFPLNLCLTISAFLLLAGCSDASSKFTCEPGAEDGERICKDGIWMKKKSTLPERDAGSLDLASTDSGLSDQGIDLGPKKPICGDGIINGLEECDTKKGGEGTGDRTCTTEGFESGEIACNSECLLDDSNCVAPPDCGNGTIDKDEECEVGMINKTCNDFGFKKGMLKCKACKFDKNECSTCGDDDVSGPEICDNENFGNLTCQNHATDSLGGKLACTQECSVIDKSACSLCGNGKAEMGEACDLNSLRDQDCSTVKGDAFFGSVSCVDDCTGFDVSQCKLRFVEVHAVKESTCALKSDGSVSCWGKNNNIPLIKGSVSHPVPTKVITMAANAKHACAIIRSTPGKTSGPIKCWGKDADDRLNAPTTGDFTSITVGNDFACAIRDVTSTIECWGSDKNNQRKITPPTGQFIQIDSGNFHSCGLKQTGAMECWGNSSDGRTIEPDSPMVQVSSGGMHNCGILKNGGIECWGKDDKDQNQDKGGKFIKVSAGHKHNCAIYKSNDHVHCWGDNGDGQSDLPDSAKIEYVDISAGEKHTCGIKKLDGTLVCWGKRDHIGVLPLP